LPHVVCVATVDNAADCSTAERMADHCASESLVLLKRRGTLGRAAVEREFISRGWRRSPFLFRFADFSQLRDNAGEQIIVLERLPVDTVERYPASWLLQERDLHMDMTREAGSRSDAHLVRYAWACQYIRRGDRVLDIACGMGYGSYLVRRNTAASVVIGADNSPSSIGYAKACFRWPRLGFGRLDAERLVNVKPDKFDVVLSFETLEHLREPEAFLRDVEKLLRPSGRIVISVPNDWSDETGRDPNPYHFHVYTLDKLERQLVRHFAVERWAAECADRVKSGDGSWKPSRRSLNEFNSKTAASGEEAEWWLACGMKSPVGVKLPYTETAFSPGEVSASGNVLAFSRDYRNPWLVRGLVTIGLRAVNEEVLEDWSAKALRGLRENPVDKAALLCVLLYRALGKSPKPGLESGKDATGLVRRAMSALASLAQESDNPTALRWRVSIAFALAQLHLLHGEPDQATPLLKEVTRLDVAQYSVLLTSKSIGASLQLAALRAVSDVRSAGIELLERTQKSLQEVGRWIADELSDDQPDFFFREIAEIVDAGTRNLHVAKLLLAGEGLAAFETAIGASLSGRALSAESTASAAHADLRRASEVHGWLEAQYRAQRELVDTHAASIQAKTEEVDRVRDELATTRHGKEWLERQYERYVSRCAELESEVARVLEEKAWLADQYNAFKAAHGALEAQLADMLVDANALRQQLAEVDAGRRWLESQFHAFRDLADRRERECDEYLNQAASARRETERLQGVLDQVSTAKDWLAQQYDSLTAEVNGLLKVAEAKEWLAKQHESLSAEVERLQRVATAQQERADSLASEVESLKEAGDRERQVNGLATAELEGRIRELIDAKVWLEGQYVEYRSLAERGRLEVAELLEQKQWLQRQYVAFKNLDIENKRSISNLVDSKQWLERQYRDYRSLAERNQSSLADLLEKKRWLEEQYRSYTKLAAENARSISGLMEAKQWLDGQYRSYKMVAERLQDELAVSYAAVKAVESDLSVANVKLQRSKGEVNALLARLAEEKRRADQAELGKRETMARLASVTAHMERFRSRLLIRFLLAARLIKDDPK
jgi:2-polyprenyl-3-methyl-5-hydroxy-6-metoxy-1,4-benzoquinol methylase